VDDVERVVKCFSMYSMVKFYALLRYTKNTQKIKLGEHVFRPTIESRFSQIRHRNSVTRSFDLLDMSDNCDTIFHHRNKWVFCRITRSDFASDS